MDKRIFVEKKADFRVKSDSLVKELQHNLQLKTLMIFGLFRFMMFLVWQRTCLRVRKNISL